PSHRPIIALVLTYRRPRLATQAVSSLLDGEGLAATDVLLVINGDGGLDDDRLQSQVHALRLPENTGPAGGFGAGMRSAFEDLPSRWLYLAEDDDALLTLPRPRVATLVERVEAFERQVGGLPVGGVVVRGRDLNRRWGTFAPHRPALAEGFDDVDVGPWTGALVSRRVVDAGG